MTNTETTHQLQLHSLSSNSSPAVKTKQKTF